MESLSYVQRTEVSQVEQELIDTIQSICYFIATITTLGWRPTPEMC